LLIGAESVGAPTSPLRKFGIVKRRKEKRGRRREREKREGRRRK